MEADARAESAFMRTIHVHRQRGSTRKEVLDAENDTNLYQLEDRSSKRSHRFEKSQEKECS